MKELAFDKKYKQNFGEKMTKVYNEWKKSGQGERRTMEVVAQRVAEIEGSGCRVNQINEYKHGRTIPTMERVQTLIKVFGCRPEDLLPIDHDDAYKYSPEFINQFGDELSRYSIDKGLNLFLLRGLRDICQQFDEEFPLFTGFTKNPNWLSDQNFIRITDESASDSAEMNSQNTIFQLKRGEKRITMSKHDVLFLLDVQEELNKMLRFLFYKRRLEMKEETARLNSLALEVEEREGIPWGGEESSAEIGSWIKECCKYIETEE